MSRRIPESELILNPDGSVYHLHLKPEHLASTVFTVGDPDRVAIVSKFFDSIEFKTSKREFVTHTGYVGKKRVTVMSTGMGTDNIEILMTELDALVNLDLETRKEKEFKNSLQIIRLGTSGAMQEDIPVGSLLASQKAVGLDTLFQFYPELGGDQEWAKEVKAALELSFLPYQAAGSDSLLAKLPIQFIKGITLTAPGFYAPQGRSIRINPRIHGMMEKLGAIKIGAERLTNFEMETAGYYGMGELLGHSMLSLNAIVANRVTKEFDNKAEKTLEMVIQSALESFC